MQIIQPFIEKNAEEINKDPLAFFTKHGFLPDDVVPADRKEITAQKLAETVKFMKEHHADFDHIPLIFSIVISLACQFPEDKTDKVDPKAIMAILHASTLDDVYANHTDVAYKYVANQKLNTIAITAMMKLLEWSLLTVEDERNLYRAITDHVGKKLMNEQ